MSNNLNNYFLLYCAVRKNNFYTFAYNLFFLQKYSTLLKIIEICPFFLFESMGKDHFVKYLSLCKFIDINYSILLVIQFKNVICFPVSRLTRRITWSLRHVVTFLVFMELLGHYDLPQLYGVTWSLWPSSALWSNLVIIYDLPHLYGVTWSLWPSSPLWSYLNIITFLVFMELLGHYDLTQLYGVTWSLWPSSSLWSYLVIMAFLSFME